MQSINSKNAPAPIGPYSQAIEVNGFIYTSGQIALSAKSGEIVSDNLEDQVHQVIKNLQSVLQAGGSDLNKVVKTTIFLANMNDFVKVNEIYSTYFNESKPARSTVEVSCLPKNVLVEIDCVAVI
ncbi:MAG: RidA family protein [Calditrichaeota bacterium]|nr:MAG: RidA family protein [Calditrichota bacterium]MBL1204472.1 RidA family protein [Calditrichota bacterium]NOG44301.1 RidA family protein [Calditrichota bacterium]